jgi:hypothetical protein
VGHSAANRKFHAKAAAPHSVGQNQAAAAGGANAAQNQRNEIDDDSGDGRDKEEPFELYGNLNAFGAPVADAVGIRVDDFGDEDAEENEFAMIFCLLRQRRGLK